MRIGQRVTNAPLPVVMRKDSIVMSAFLTGRRPLLGKFVPTYFVANLFVVIDNHGRMRQQVLLEVSNRRKGSLLEVAFLRMGIC
jgi:hypothetical protein